MNKPLSPNPFYQNGGRETRTDKGKSLLSRRWIVRYLVFLGLEIT